MMLLMPGECGSKGAACCRYRVKQSMAQAVGIKEQL